MNRYLEKIEPRQLFLLMSILVLILVTLFLTYFISPKFKEYRSILKTHESLKKSASSNQNIIKQLQVAKNAVSQLKTRLHADVNNIPASQIESYLIGRLQQIAWQHNIELSGIKPSGKKEIDAFQEIVFHVSLAGNYFDLYSWLKDLSKELGFTVIQQFEMHPIESDKISSRLTASLIIASYIGVKE